MSPNFSSMEMKTLVEQFPAQLEKAIEIAGKAELPAIAQPVANVLITGLGGSGIGGTIVSELAFGSANVPVQVTKGYFIPAYVNERTLVIVSSYSGNTEETLACMKQARNAGANICCITSGGEVEKLAREYNCGLILIPGGMPPRSCLGYSLTQLIAVFVRYGLLAPKNIEQLKNSVSLLKSEKPAIISHAQNIALAIAGKTTVIYCTTLYEGVAIRLRQQLNENAKVLCWHHVIPEMNHNELVGWAGGNDNIAVLMLRDPQEYERNEYRMQLNKEIITKYTPHFFELTAKGNSLIEKYIYLIHLGDWISVELAALRNVDATEVNVINFLKGELNKK